MSFGSETGRTRSGTKGFSSKEKKQKKKKQEYHVHRRGHFQESERHDPEEVRARTILALDKLGHQVLSTEPGGYDLRAWMKSLDSLLDDFQEKAGAGRVTEELRAKREEALASLVPPSREETDREIEKLNLEEAAIKAALEEEGRRASARRAALKEERDACAKELKAEREKLSEIKETKKSRAFFSRIRSSGPSTEQSEAKVAELESKLRRLEEEVDRRPKPTPATGEEAPSDDESKLEAVQKRLAELHAAREAGLQLASEREAATKTISDAISSMKLDGGTSGAGAIQAQ